MGCVLPSGIIRQDEATRGNIHSHREGVQHEDRGRPAHHAPGDAGNQTDDGIGHGDAENVKMAPSSNGTSV